MKLGRSLWILIGIKLIILFGIVKVLFFPNYLKNNFANDEARGAYVLEQLTQKEKQR